VKRIFIFPTIEEAKAFILTEPRDPVFVGGVGPAEIAAATVRAVKAKKPQLVVLCGIAGAYDSTLRRGDVVEVITERIAGLPERYVREYEATGPDMGLPLAEGVSVDRSGGGLPQAQTDGSDMAARAHDTEAGSPQTLAAVGRQTEAAQGAERETEARHGTEYEAGESRQESLPRIENMEGAAFFAVCEALGVASCQIRAVSNYVGEPFDEWAVEEAVANLTGILTKIVENNE